MMDLTEALGQYLKLRRSLGFKLQSQESRLRNFVEFAQARGEQYITSKLSVEWANHLKFSGHSLRAGLASSAEVDERYVQKQLGHASAEMTRKYQRRRDRFRVNLTKASGL
jgi:integrase